MGSVCGNRPAVPDRIVGSRQSAEKHQVIMMRAVATAFLAAGLGLAHGAETPQGGFGTWGGLRTALSDYGVEFEGSYINESAANVSGGESREAASADQIFLGGSLDLNRLVSVPG